MSQRTGIPASRLTEITKVRRAIKADTALRLGRFFGTGERFWLTLQQAYDLENNRFSIAAPKTSATAPALGPAAFPSG